VVGCCGFFSGFVLGETWWVGLGWLELERFEYQKKKCKMFYDLYTF